MGNEEDSEQDGGCRAFGVIANVEADPKDVVDVGVDLSVIGDGDFDRGGECGTKWDRSGCVKFVG